MTSQAAEKRTEPQGSFLGTGRIILLMLAAALVLRVAIIFAGGQGFAPDESRYIVSQQAIARILAGEVRAGLVMPLASGEHPGFKLAGLLPALVQAKFGGSDRVPALFFGGFSVLNLLLIWGCARRLGFSEAAQVWTVAFAVCSVALFFYARHLFPYDLAMSLALAGLWLGLRPGAGWGRCVAVGLCCGAAFACYLAYWLLAGAVMLVVVLYQGGNWWRLPLRGLAVAAGFLLPLAALWLLNKWGGAELVESGRKFSGSAHSGNFGSGWWIQWQYLFVAEGLRAAAFIAAAAWALLQVARDRRHRTWSSPLVVPLVAVGALYAMMVLASDYAKMIDVTGRVSRVLVPFLCLLAGAAVAQVLERWRRPAVAWLFALVLPASAAGAFATVLLQRFPADFRARGEALLRHRAPDNAESYHRFVNVDHFIYAPEILRAEPAATLLAAPHPYQFAPYLYEGFNPPERRRRLAVDHRMRLVRMEVPLNARIQGEPDGILHLKVKFPSGRDGLSEPLASLGAPGRGMLFFARYVRAGWVELGMESMGNVGRMAPPMEIVPGRTYDLALFCGSLLGGEEKVASASVRYYLKNLVTLAVDGREVLNSFAPSHPATPAQVHVGVNLVGADSAETAFSGEIVAARRGGYPTVPGEKLETGQQTEAGAVQVTARMPAHAAGVPEPMVVVGVTGDATMGFVRVLPGGRIKVGVEIWGVGAYESDPVPAPSTRDTEIVFAFPALFPPVGDPRWGTVPAAEQEALRSQITLSVNGRVVLQRRVEAPPPKMAPVHFAENPVGGSYVTSAFTGQMQVTRRPLGGR